MSIRCGECECFKKEAPHKVYGKFCECDNFSCDRHNDEVCSGPNHGTCECGVCKCNEGWEGPDCSCKIDQQDCINPKTNKICSDRGKCVCGECKCNQSTSEHEQYTGQFCEDCPTCKKMCDIYKDCVQCRIHHSGPLTEEECRKCEINPVGTSDWEGKVEEGEESCVIWDENDRVFNFKYFYNELEKVTYVVAQNTKDCPEPVDILAIVIGVIVGIVLIGLAVLLIWKLLTTIHDRREVANFNEEKSKVKWDTVSDIKHFFLCFV